jgi:hypothetical protein
MEWSPTASCKIDGAINVGCDLGSLGNRNILAAHDQKSGESTADPMMTVPVLSSPFLVDDARKRRLLPSGALA